MGVPFTTQLSPHARPRRRPISALVVHYSGSIELDATAAWMCRPDAHYSVHYLIGRAGQVIRLVPDDQVAFHCGRSAMTPEAANDAKEPHVDEFSLGIELIGTPDSGFTDQQMASLIGIVERLVQTYRIHPDRIMGHRQIAPGRKLDPDGFNQQFDWRRVRAAAESTFHTLS